MTNFTLQDTIGTTRAIVAFAAILLCPGYLLGWAADLFGFRRRLLSERLAWAIALSFATTPIFVELAGRLIGIPGVAIAAAVCAAGTLALLFLDRKSIRVPRGKYVWMLLIFLLLGSVLLVAQLLDIQIGNRLNLSVTVLDQGYRVGFTNAIARAGIPPANPFYHPGASQPLRYYYFWYALCAVCTKLAHVSARQALIASSVWSGLGLTAMIALFMRHFMQVRQGLRRQIATAALLLMVTGADLLPVFYNLFAHNDFAGETEWWSADQITSWMDTLLWVPNHAAALIGCLVVFLLVWRAIEKVPEELPARQKTVATVLAGVAAASSFGMSIYVTAGLAMMLAAWALWLAARGQGLKAVARLAVAAVVAGVLLLPYLHDLLGARSGTEGRGAGGPAHVLAFGFRGMIDPGLIAALPAFARWHAAHPVLLDQLTRLALLLPGYALELGFFAVVLLLAWIDRKRLDEARRAALFLALTGLAIVSVVRSAVIGNNDFGTRAALLPCFFLLLLGTGTLLDLYDEKIPAQKWRGAVVAPLLLLGLAGTAFQALGLRFYIPIHSSHRAAGFEDLAETVLDTRAAYAAANRAIPANAIVQSNPTGQGSYFYVANMLFSDRAMATDAAPDCGAVFGGDPAPCQATQEALRHLFNSAGPSSGQTAVEARALCARLDIQYLAASRHDPAWQDRRGWVWALPAIAGPAAPDSAAGGTMRIVRCGDGP